MATSVADCESLKLAGNDAIKAGNFASAEAIYTEALSSLLASPPDASTSLHTALLCNRAHTRFQLGRHDDSIQDSSEALSLMPLELGADDLKLKVKALYRRGLACEALGQVTTSYEDLNLALKLAPTNAGILAAATRLKGQVPRSDEMPKCRLGFEWIGDNRFYTVDVMQLADSDQFPGRLRGYSLLDENPVVRFANGFGVQSCHDKGVLVYIRQYGPPSKAKADHVTKAKDYHDLPNFPLCDGLVAKYSCDGCLSHIAVRRGGELDGVHLAFTPDGKRCPAGSYVREAGRLGTSVVCDDLDNADEVVSRALVELVLPVKKALQIGLSPGEHRLCEQHRINTGVVRAMDFSQEPQVLAEHRRWDEERRRDNARPPPRYNWNFADAETKDT